MNRYLLPILLLLALDAKVLAQFRVPDQSIPPMLARLAVSKPDTNRAGLLLDLGYAYDRRQGDEPSDLDSALRFLLAGKALSDSLHYPPLQIWARLNLGKFYFDRENNQQGRSYFQQVISLCQTTVTPLMQATLFEDMGTFSTQMSDSLFPERNWALHRSLELYKALKDQRGQASALKDLADMHLNQGNLNLADSELLQALAIFKSLHSRDLHYTYDLLSATARNAGHLNKALYYALEAVRSMQATGDTTSASSFYKKVADVYRDLGQSAESIVWYKRAADSYVFAFGSAAYQYIVNMAIEMVRLGKAREARDMVLEMVRQHGYTDDYSRLDVAYALGVSHEALKEYEEAEKYYLEMMKWERIASAQYSRNPELYCAIAKFYINRHQFERARPYLAEALAFTPGIVPLADQLVLHLLYFKVDSASGRLDSAILHYQQYKTLSDTMITIARSRQIEELQIQYKTEKKEQDLAILRTQSQLQEKALGASAQLRNFTFAGILMLLLLLGLGYNRYRLKQKSNRLLQTQQQEINVKNQHLEHMVEEKEWLLREIHHRVKNNLQIIISLLNTQSAFINNEAALAAIRESRHRMQAMSLIHQKLYQHDNIALIDMSAYIPELMNYLKESFNILRDLRFDLQVDPIKLDVTQAIPVALILNETITNTLKHAFPEKKRGGEISVVLRYTDAKKILLSIADNGVGFTHDAQPDPNASFGMNLINILSQQLEGDLTIHNEGGITINILFKPVLSSLPVM